METLQIWILGLVQGITEFLPISSSAHLILVPHLVQWPDQGVVFDVAVHMGTLLAVAVYFYKDVLLIARGKYDILRGQRHSVAARLVLNLAVSTLPVLLLGYALKDFIADAGRSIAVLASTSIVFGLLLWWADKRPERQGKNVEKMQLLDAVIFGVFQAIAIIPGTSRSGICMTCGRFLGYNRTEASRYAMLMAMPVIFVMGAYTVVSDMHAALSWHENSKELLLGMAVSFASALLAIYGLMKLVERMSFLPFVIYRIVLGVGLWLFILL